MTSPPLPYGHLLRLDAARVLVEDDGSRNYQVLARIRSAAELGPSLTPYTIVDWGTVEFGVDLPYDEPDLPVVAVRADDSVTGLDQSGGYVTRSSDSPYLVAGSPLIAATSSDPSTLGQAYFTRQDLTAAGLRVIGALWSDVLRPGRWRAASSTARSRSGYSAMENLLRSFGHPLYPGNSPLGRAQSELEPWREPLRAVLQDPAVDDLMTARLGGVPDGGNDHGTISIDAGAFLAALAADPAAAVLLGSMGLVDDQGEVGHATSPAVAAIGTYAIPLGAQGAVYDLARQWAQDTAPDQDEVTRLLAGIHEGLAECWDGLSGTHEFVHLWAPAVIAPLPDPPARARVQSDVQPVDVLTTAVRIDRTQGGPVAVYRHAGDDERKDVILLPASGVVTDDSWETDPPVTAEYTVWVQDLWGQWSEETSCSVSARVPPTAPPSVDLEFRPVPPTAPDGAVSPGRVHVRAFATDPPFGGAAITSMTAAIPDSVEGTIPLEPDAEARWWEGSAQVRPTVPGECVDVEVTVTARTVLNALNDVHRHVLAADGRPVEVDASSPHLLFSGERRPDGSAEVDLVLQGAHPPAGTTYRLYMADESALRELSWLDRERPRYRRVPDLLGRTDRSKYVPLPAAALSTEAGRTRLRVTLPGRSSALRVLQLVPVTAAGVETPADRCRAFVVAAPLDDTPGTAALAVQRAMDGTPRAFDVTVTVTHPIVELGDSPGPFLRRGRTGRDPLPAQVLWAPVGTTASGAMVATKVDLEARHPDVSFGLWKWMSTVRLTLPPEVPPYTQLVLWARAAWPAEPAGPHDADSNAGSVKRRWGVLQEQPGEWGPLSPPASVVAADSDPDVSVEVLTPIDLSWHVSVPPVDPAGPGWQVSAASAEGHSEQTLHGPGTVYAPIPSFLAADLWRISITCPDGTAGPVFTGLGERL